MFDRIVMYVIKVPVEIPLIPDDMIPESSLPKGYVFFVTAKFLEPVRKSELYRLHDLRKMNNPFL